jgi:predicted phosphohydrolase
LRRLVTYINAEGRSEDVLLVGGDIAIDDAGIAACLARFRDFPGKKAAVAGNHDIWIDRDDSHTSSSERHYKVQDIFRASGFVPLEEEPLIVDGVGFVGAMGWYDGSFIDKSLGISDQAYATKTPPWSHQAVWADAFMTKWHCSDKEVADWQLDKLRAGLNRVSGLREIVTLVHHVPTGLLLPFPRARWLVPRKWRFANAFLGSNRFSELIGRFPNVSTVMSGHIHRSGEVLLDGRRYLSIGGDYDSKQLLTIKNARVSRRSFFA